MRRFRDQVVEAVDLHTTLIRALGDFVVGHGKTNGRPMDLDLRLPLPQRVRVYLFGVTPHDAKRSPGTYLATLPATARTQGNQVSPGGKSDRLVLLMGYEPEWQAFVLWDSLCYPILGRGPSLMVSDQTLVSAFTGQLAQETRTVWGAAGKEIVLAARADVLGSAIARRFELWVQQLTGGGGA